MGLPDQPLPSPETLVNAVRAVGVRGLNQLITLDDFNALIDEYDAYTPEVRDELKRICEVLSEDFEAMKVIGTFKLAMQFALICKFDPRQPQFSSLLALLEEIRQRAVLLPGDVN